MFEKATPRVSQLYFRVADHMLLIFITSNYGTGTKAFSAVQIGEGSLLSIQKKWLTSFFFNLINLKTLYSNNNFDYYFVSVL